MNALGSGLAILNASGVSNVDSAECSGSVGRDAPIGNDREYRGWREIARGGAAGASGIDSSAIQDVEEEGVKACERGCGM